MRIRFGTFETPLGQRAVEGEWTFVACVGQLEGKGFELLRDPDELADFTARVFHPGACIYLDYACQGGAVSLTETDDDRR